MNKLPLDTEPNFKDAEFIKTLSLAINLSQTANSPEMKRAAEQAIEALVIAWYNEQNFIEN